MKLFTFFTKNTPYEQEANLTIEAFASFGMQCAAVAYDSKKDWMLNAMARAAMLEEFAQQYPAEAIGIIDADNRPIQRPQKLLDFNAHVGCEDRGERKKTNMRYSAGIVVFGVHELGRKVLHDWRQNCDCDAQKVMPLREQYYLWLAIQAARAKSEFIFENFGNAYNRKPEDVKQGDDTVFIHDVASRKYLKKIGGRR